MVFLVIVLMVIGIEFSNEFIYIFGMVLRLVNCVVLEKGGM